MPRITIGASSSQGDNGDDKNFDFKQLEDPGMTVLKFGKGGTPHERVVRITGNHQFLFWTAGWFSRKLGKKCVVDLEKVSRVMTGQKTYAFQRWAHRYGFAEDKSLSLVYADDNGRETSFDIILATEEQYQFWLDGVNFLIKKIKERRSRMSVDDLRLEAQWKKADADCSGTLSSGEIVKLIATLNINMPTKTIMKYFRMVDIDGSNELNLDEFVELMSLLLVRAELAFVWRSMTRGPQLTVDIIPFVMSAADTDAKKIPITLNDLVMFWESVQGEPISQLEMMTALSEATGIQDMTLWEKTPITFATWSKLMSNSTNDIFNPSKSVIYQDMSRPLSHYFISSSHNTYLEGDQLTSASSVNRYINDLLNGCRCVELDCWDGEKNDPVIFHGKTLTTKIFFRDVIKAIEQYSFVNSKYPVILSIENHCNLEQQRVLAAIMKDTFKEKLAWPQDYPDGYLPSPEELAYKILVKGKRISSSASLEEEDEDEDEDEDVDDRSTVNGRSMKSSEKLSSSQKVPELSSQFSYSSNTQSQTSGDTSTTGKGKSKEEKKVHPDLSAITFLGTCKVKEFSDRSFQTVPCDSMSSYSETKTEKFLKDTVKVQGWLKHNQKHMSRIYPKGSRIDSSNYDPAVCWVAGCQMVALNYQTNDFYLHVNHGRFRENGNCGYIVKPEFMLSSVPDLREKPTRFAINIISAQQLPKPGGAQSGEIIDPFVVVHINGHPIDIAEHRTKTIADNGFNPIWNEVFNFRIMFPDLAILTFEVFDEDVVLNEFVAFASLPLTCVRTGIRNVPLCDVSGKREQDFAFASLCVRCDIIPDDED